MAGKTLDSGPHWRLNYLPINCSSHQVRLRYVPQNSLVKCGQYSELDTFSATAASAKSSQQLSFLFRSSFLHLLLKSLCSHSKVLLVVGCRLKAWVTVKLSV